VLGHYCCCCCTWTSSCPCAAACRTATWRYLGRRTPGSRCPGCRPPSVLPAAAWLLLVGCLSGGCRNSRQARQVQHSRAEAVKRVVLGQAAWREFRQAYLLCCDSCACCCGIECCLLPAGCTVCWEAAAVKAYDEMDVCSSCACLQPILCNKLLTESSLLHVFRRTFSPVAQRGSDGCVAPSRQPGATEPPLLQGCFHLIPAGIHYTI
jgi:hypothetical protein